MLKREREQQEMEECSFTPDTSLSKKAVFPQQRNLYGFLSDQQRFLENKNMKILQEKQKEERHKLEIEKMVFE